MREEFAAVGYGDVIENKQHSFPDLRLLNSHQLIQRSETVCGDERENNQFKGIIRAGGTILGYKGHNNNRQSIKAVSKNHNLGKLGGSSQFMVLSIVSTKFHSESNKTALFRRSMNLVGPFAGSALYCGLIADLCTRIKAQRSKLSS